MRSIGDDDKKQSAWNILLALVQSPDGITHTKRTITRERARQSSGLDNTEADAILDRLFSSVASGGKLAYYCAEMAIRSLRLIIRYPIPLPLQVIDRNSLHQFAFSPAFAMTAAIGVTTVIIA